jgi:hypothetical protein
MLLGSPEEFLESFGAFLFHHLCTLFSAVCKKHTHVFHLNSNGLQGKQKLCVKL